MALLIIHRSSPCSNGSITVGNVVLWCATITPKTRCFSRVARRVRECATLALKTKTHRLPPFLLLLLLRSNLWQRHPQQFQRHPPLLWQLLLIFRLFRPLRPRFRWQQHHLRFQPMLQSRSRSRLPQLSFRYLKQLHPRLHPQLLKAPLRHRLHLTGRLWWNPMQPLVTSHPRPPLRGEEGH